MQRIFKGLIERPTNPAFDTILTEQRQRPYVRKFGIVNSDTADQDTFVDFRKSRALSPSLVSKGRNGGMKTGKRRGRGRWIQRDRGVEHDDVLDSEDKSDDEDKELELGIESNLVDAIQRRLPISPIHVDSSSNKSEGIDHETQVQFLEPRAARTSISVEVNNVMSSMLMNIEQNQKSLQNMRKRPPDVNVDSSSSESKKKIRVNDVSHL